MRATSATVVAVRSDASTRPIASGRLPITTRVARAGRSGPSEPAYQSASGPLRHRRRLERLLDHSENSLAPALGDRLQPAQLEPRELDPARHPHGAKAEVGEEVSREDRAVDEEALVRGLGPGIGVRKRLEAGGALVLRLTDGGQEQRLQHPR